MAKAIKIVGAADLYISPWRKVRRSRSERWLSWPWRPWRAWKYEPSMEFIANQALKGMSEMTVNPRLHAKLSRDGHTEGDADG